MNADNADTEEKPKPFTEKGKCFDEVRLIFDDKNELFVSQNFLMLSSPVFEAMFKHNFKEKQSMTINITGKNYADFLEFLMCIHPGTLKPIDETNVLRIAPVAEEYQVSSVIQRCQSYMRSWLDKELQKARQYTEIRYHVCPARNCLLILKVANLLNYDELEADSSSVVARFGHRLYYGSYQPDSLSYSNVHIEGASATVKDVINECRELFNSLQAELRCKLLSQRLALYSDNNIK